MKSRFFRARARNVPEPGDGIIVLVIDIFLPVVFKKMDSFYNFPEQHEGNFCLKLRLHPILTDFFHDKNFIIKILTF